MYIYFLLRSCHSHQTYFSALLFDAVTNWANHKPFFAVDSWQVLPTGRVRKKLEDGYKGIASLSSLFYQLHFTQRLLRQQLNSISVGVKLTLLPYSQNEIYALFPACNRFQIFGAFLWALKAPAIDQEGPFSESLGPGSLELLTSDHCHFTSLLPQLQGLLFSVVIIILMA